MLGLVIAIYYLTQFDRNNLEHIDGLSEFEASELINNIAFSKSERKEVSLVEFVDIRLKNNWELVLAANAESKSISQVQYYKNSAIILFDDGNINVFSKNKEYDALIEKHPLGGEIQDFAILNDTLFFISQYGQTVYFDGNEWSSSLGSFGYEMSGQALLVHLVMKKGRCLPVLILHLDYSLAKVGIGFIIT